MKHTIRSVQYVAVALLLVGGCGRAVTGQSNADGGVEPDTGVVTVERPVRVCSPQPASQVSAVAPQLFTWVREIESLGCQLERVDRDSDGDGIMDEVITPAPGEVECLNASCTDRTEPLSTVAKIWSQDGPWWPDHWRGIISGQRVVEAGAIRYEVTLEGRTDGSSATQRVERTYDQAGRVLWDRHHFNSSLWSETTNLWSDGRLLESVHVDGVNGTGTSRLVFEYDSAGRLHRARQVDAEAPDETQQAMTWTYDEWSRPTRSVHTIAGTNFIERTWTWEGAEDGRLLERSAQTTPLGERPWPRVNLDDHAPDELHHDWTTRTFNGALFQIKGDGATACSRIPTAVAHGYPAAEGLWELGWAGMERPGGIGFDYGYNGYAYYYGEHGWFGHGGVAVEYAPIIYGSPASVTVRYDEAERMVAESASTIMWEDDEWTFERKRQYSGEQLVRDTLEVTTRGSETPETTFTSVLDFEYEAGQVTSRTWSIAGLDAADHGWEYDAEGRLLAHTINFDVHLATSPSWPNVQPPPEGHTPEWRSVRWDQSWNEAGTEMTRTKAMDGEPLEYTETWSSRPMAGGLLIERNGGFELLAADGTLLAQGWGDVAAPDWVYERELDENGLLQSWGYRGESASRTETETYTHVCE